MPEKIDRFRDEYRFLSNFWPAPIGIGDLVFPTAEHAYQASKTVIRGERLEVQRQETPGKAKRSGRRVTLRKGWNDMRLEVMLDILRQKFANHHLRSQLLATGDVELIEGNHWGDIFWGVDCSIGAGCNHLGKLLMQVRKELRGNFGVTEPLDDAALAAKRDKELAESRCVDDSVLQEIREQLARRKEAAVLTLTVGAAVVTRNEGFAEALVEEAAEFFSLSMGVAEDFCVQTGNLDMGVVVFGGMNRLKWSLKYGFLCLEGHCSPAFIARYKLLMH